MRTTLIIIILILIGGEIILYFNHPTSSTDVVVLKDITDTLLSEPNANEIVPLFNLSGNARWNGGGFRLSDVSDVSLNKQTTLKIEKQNQWLSNEIERDKEVGEFQQRIVNTLTTSQREQIGKTHSSIYLSIGNELKFLSESKSENRILLVYSDLMENTSDISFYNEKIVNAIVNDPSSVKKLLNNLQPLPPLNGIQIRFIYQPANIQADESFRVVSGFYKKLLEEKGATVSISANLNE